MSKKWRLGLLRAVAQNPLLALALGTATKILVQIEEMAADKSILSTVYVKRGARQSPEAYI
jgi:hypothetical protein